MPTIEERKILFEKEKAEGIKKIKDQLQEKTDKKLEEMLNKCEQDSLVKKSQFFLTFAEINHLPAMNPIWYYIDPQERYQGPFASMAMHEWSK
jgi:GYF domain